MRCQERAATAHEPEADQANEFAATRGAKSACADSHVHQRCLYPFGGGWEPTQVGLAFLLPRFQPPG